MSSRYVTGLPWGIVPVDQIVHYHKCSTGGPQLVRMEAVVHMTSTPLRTHNVNLWSG